MFQFSTTQKEDLREAAKIARRRQCEEERKGRIFNAKQRVLGVDYKSLEEQIAEKKRNHQISIENDKKYAEIERLQGEILRAKEQEVNLQRQRILADINFYRKEFQKKTPLPEEPYVEPGISSAQTFSGEDASAEERRRTQRNQQKAWLEQQILERKQAEKSLSQAEQAMQETLESRDRRALELDAARRGAQKAMKAAIADYNKNLAAEMHDQRNRQKQAEQQDNMAEILNQLSSDMLNESLDTAQSNFGPSKIIPYMYRGRTPEEVLAFKREQEQQIEEVSKLRAMERMTEKQWDEYSKTVNRNLLLRESDLDKRHRQLLEEYRKQNQRLAVEQKKHNEYVEKVVYKNEASDEFFAQFNTTTR